MYATTYPSLHDHESGGSGAAQPPTRFGKRDARSVGAERGQAVEQVLRVEGDRQVIAGEVRLDYFLGLRLVTGPGLEHQLTGTERKPDRCIELSHQGHA